MGRLQTEGQGVYEVAKRFAERVVEKLDGRIEAVILYGSVARGESRSDSDIDMMILGRRKSDWKKVLEVAYEIDSENNFLTFISPTFYRTPEFEANVLHGSFFARRVLREGVVLYDNGSYERIRDKVLTAG